MYASIEILQNKQCSRIFKIVLLHIQKQMINFWQTLTKDLYPEYTSEQDLQHILMLPFITYHIDEFSLGFREKPEHLKKK